MNLVSNAEPPPVSLTASCRGGDLPCTSIMIKVYFTHLPKSNQDLCWLQQLAGDERWRDLRQEKRWGGPHLVQRHCGGEAMAGQLEAVALGRIRSCSPLHSGQTGWINHLQRCQHLPKQFQIGINGRWGCCSLCLISSTKCGFISYKMKPSVARRCKYQVREDAGRGWRRERWGMCWECARMCSPLYCVFGVCVAMEGRERNETQWNRSRKVGVKWNKKEKLLSIMKRENVTLQQTHTSTLIYSFFL